MRKFSAFLPVFLAMACASAAELNILPLEERHFTPDDVDVAVFPHSFIDADNVFCLNEKRPTPMMIVAANPRGGKLEEVSYQVTLPSPVKLLTVNHQAAYDKITGIPGKDTVSYELPALFWHPVSISEKPVNARYPYSSRRPLVLWLKSELPADRIAGTMQIRLKYKRGGKTQFSPFRTIRLKGIRNFRGKTPRRVVSMLMGRFTLGIADVNNETLAGEFAAALGYNAILGNFHRDALPAGLKLWQEIGVQNEVAPGVDPRFITPDAAFAGSPRKKYQGLVCPQTIYKRTKWFRRHLESKYTEAIEDSGVHGIFSNHEPYIGYLQNGCFCQNCRKEFLAFSGLQASDIGPDLAAAAKGRYKEEWRKFRNWQDGKVVAVLNDTIRALGGELCIITANDALWGEKGFSLNCGEWGNLDYFLTTWQYYWVPTVERKFPYNDRMNAWQAGRSAGLERHLKHIWNGKMKMKYGCVYGYEQGASGGFFTPEQLKFLHESAVFCGNRFACNYPELPLFDGRWANAAARANDRIARWENLILDGTIENTRKTEIVSPNPELRLGLPQNADSEKVICYGNELDGRYLISLEYRNGDRRVIPVANLWQHGGCFFRLKLSVPEGNYTLTEPESKTAWGGRTLSAGDLNKGILLHAPAASWSVFVLTKNGNTDGYKLITEKQADAMLRKQTPRLREILKKYPPDSQLKKH